MSFACIFVPDFPVEALLRVEPELRSHAVAVLEGKAPLQKVRTVNEKARRNGILPGMTKLQIETCPDLVLRNCSTLQEAAAHAALLDCAQSFSPRVEDAGCDTVLLDLAGLEPLFGSFPKIARNLARRACDLGLESHVAVASNPDTAVIAAQGFSGVTVIPEGKEAWQLGSLPLEVLFRRDSNLQDMEILERWGIRNLRALAALPDIALSERLGQEGVRLQQLARGCISRTLVPVEAPLIFEEAIELEYPLMLLEPLAFLLSRLLEQLCARLGTRVLATQELRLNLTLEHPPDGCSTTNHVGTGALTRPGRAQDRRVFERTLRLPVPLLDPKIFLKLLQLDLNAHPPGAPIVKIHLLAEPARPRAMQGGLFLPPSPEAEKLELTLARIAGIVGENKVGSLRLLDTHRPEGFLMQRFAPNGRNSVVKNNGVKNMDPNLQTAENTVTALRIFRPPARATVTVDEGRPTRIVCPKRKEISGEILWAAGPWRTSGDWWEQEGWAHDEWDIALQETAGIALYRLVRDLLSGQWRVEGSYD